MEEQINENLQQPIQEEDTQQQSKKVETQDTTAQIVKLKKRFTLVCIIAIVALLIAGFLLIMSFCCHSDKSKTDKTETKSAKIVQNGNMKIAYINTDTIMAQYEYAKELETAIKSYQLQIENELRNAANNLQRDYEDYMKTGEKLTLTKQKEKEKELTERQQRLPALQQELAAKLQERQKNDNDKLVKAIYAFIEEYNKTHDNYNIILTRSFLNSPVLYADQGLDITDEIIKGLNEEYKNLNKK
jgi:outer membrane protein